MSGSELWDWIRGIASLVGTVVGLPGLIALLLQRKGANKKLDLEEKGSDVSEFQALNQMSASIVMQARQAMLDAQEAATAAQAEAAAARTEAAKARAANANYRSERDQFRDLMEKVVDSLKQMRDLFTTYTDRTGVPLTPEEKAIWTDTIDPRTLPARRRKR